MRRRLRKKLVKLLLSHLVAGQQVDVVDLAASTREWLAKTSRQELRWVKRLFRVAA